MYKGSICGDCYLYTCMYTYGYDRGYELFHQLCGLLAPHRNDRHSCKYSSKNIYEWMETGMQVCFKTNNMSNHFGPMALYYPFPYPSSWVLSICIYNRNT